MATIRFTDEDRDDRGFVKMPEPRSLAELLPAPAPVPEQTIQKRPITKGEIAAMIGLGLLAVVLLAYLWQSRAGPAATPLRPASVARPTGDVALTPSPLPATAPAAASRLLIAFAAPDGVALGAIESTRAITPTAHYGTAWIQADVAGSGLVWLRAADAPALAIVGADLAPAPTALPVPTAEPPPPPAPTQCASVGVAGKESRSCGTEDLSVLQERAKQMWVEAFGGNVGIVTTPTPYGGTP